MNKEERSGLVQEACARRWNNNRTAFRDFRNGLVLTYDHQPDFILGKDGAIVGVDAWVRLHGLNGVEIPIDPHRRIINPPTVHEGNDDPLEAFMEAVWASVDETPNPRGWRTRGTVDTIYPSLDGEMYSPGSSYSIAREGTGSIQARPTDATSLVGQFFAGSYACYQNFLAFDTSAITDTDTISAVDFSAYLVSDSSDTDFVLEVREKDWGSTFETADFVPGSQLSTYTLLASLNTSGIGSTGAYKTFTSETAFLTTTNIKTGTVRFFTSSSRQLLNNTPSANELVEFSQMDASGTTQDPKLVITHSAEVQFIGWGIPII